MEQPDAQTYIFTIRDGVKVGPNPLGVPERALDASDVIESYKRVVTLPQSNAYALHRQVAATARRRRRTTRRTPSRHRSHTRTSRTASAAPINTIVPKEALTDADIGKLKQQAAGAGPFILKSYTEGQGATLDRNPNYYRKDDKNSGAQSRTSTHST